MLHVHFSAEIIPCADTNQEVDNNTLLNFRSLVRSLSLISGFSCNVCDVVDACRKPGKKVWILIYSQNGDVLICS